MAAGCLWGDWGELEARVRNGLICSGPAGRPGRRRRGRAQRGGCRDLRGGVPLRARSRGRRRSRGLAREARADDRRMARLLSGGRCAADPLGGRPRGDSARSYEADDDEVAEAMVCEAVCSGLAGRLVERLAGRAAIHARAIEEAASAGGAPDDGAAAGLAAAVPDDQLERFLPALSAPARRERVTAVATLEASWRRFAALARAPRQRCAGWHRLPAARMGARAPPCRSSRRTRTWRRRSCSA